MTWELIHKVFFLNFSLSLNNCFYRTLPLTDMASRLAPSLLANFNGTVVETSWKISDLACCNTVELLFCDLKRLAKAIAVFIKQIYQGPLTNVWLIGHSFGNASVRLSVLLITQ